MTTRRILKKELIRVAYELADAVERAFGTEVLNTQAVGKTADDFLRGAVPEGAEKEVFENFTMLPLKLKDILDSAAHLVFERWPLRVTLRLTKGVVNVSELEVEYESHRSSHPHTRVRFLEADYRELKRELVGRVKKTPPAEPS